MLTSGKLVSSRYNGHSNENSHYIMALQRGSDTTTQSLKLGHFCVRFFLHSEEFELNRKCEIMQIQVEALEK